MRQTPMLLRAVLMSAVACLPASPALTQAYDPLGAAGAYGPPSAPQSPGSLSQAGSAAQQAANESRSQAAQTLDRGIRGEIAASEIRGLSDSAAALGSGTLTSEQQAKMAAQVNGGMEEVRRMMQQQSGLGGLGGSVVCEQPQQVTGGGLEARARGATHAYLSALQAGDAAGVKDAIRRGQDATADMNALTSSTGGCKDYNAPPKQGSQVTDVQSGKSGAGAEARAKAELERRSREYLRLALAAAADPQNPKKKAAAEAAGAALEAYREEHSGELDTYEVQELAAKMEAEYLAEVKKLYVQYARELNRLRNEMQSNPDDKAKAAAFDRAQERLDAFDSGPGLAIPIDQKIALEASVQGDFGKLVQKGFEDLSRQVSDLRLEALFDPGDPAKTAALKEAEAKLAEYRKNPDLEKEQELVNAKVDASYKEATFHALEAEIIKLGSLRDEMRNSPDSEMKRIAFEGARDRLDRILKEHPDDFDMSKVEEMMKMEAENYRISAQNNFQKEVQQLVDLRVAAKSDPYNPAKQKAYEDMERLLQAKEKATPDDFDTPQFQQMIKTEEQSYKDKMGDVLEDRARQALELLDRHRADPGNADLKNDFITASLKVEAFAENNKDVLDPDRVEALSEKLGREVDKGDVPQPPKPAAQSEDGVS